MSNNWVVLCYGEEVNL